MPNLPYFIISYSILSTLSGCVKDIEKIENDNNYSVYLLANTDSINCVQIN